MSNDGDFGKNLVIFGTDINSSVYFHNEKKDILVLDKSPTQGLDDTELIAEVEYSTNFTKQGNKFCSSPHTIEATVTFFLMD